jgi:hypothetical protein
MHDLAEIKVQRERQQREIARLEKNLADLLQDSST